MNEECRSEFLKLLNRSVSEFEPMRFSDELHHISQTYTPMMLYRYRECKPHTFAELRNSDPPFSQPSSFYDDPEDAYVPFDISTINALNIFVTEPMFGMVSSLARMSPKERSLRLCELRGTRPRVDLFDGDGQLHWKGRNVAEMSDEELKAAILDTI